MAKTMISQKHHPYKFTRNGYSCARNNCCC